MNEITNRSVRVAGVVVAVVAVVLPAGPTGSFAATRPASAKQTVAKQPTKEVSPAGDIPDDQAFVPYRHTGGLFTVSVPEGWSRTTVGTAVAFTDKLNTIEVVSGASSLTPSHASELAAVALLAADARVSGAKASTVKRKAGSATLVRFQRQGSANAVTGKARRKAVERYTFWRPGTAVVLTLSGPLGADNVDPWRIVSDSFVWNKAQ